MYAADNFSYQYELNIVSNVTSFAILELISLFAVWLEHIFRILFHVFIISTSNIQYFC
jgi:hypothetical protein